MSAKISTLICIFFLFTFTFVSAQLSKGDMSLGGSFYLSAGKSGFTVSAAPAVGLMVSNRIMVGITLSPSYYNYSGDSYGYLGSGVFSRIYFPVSNTLYVFGGGHASGAHVIGNPNPTNWSGNLMEELGASYFITPNVALEGIFQYRQYFNETEYQNGHLTFRVGFQVYLKRKKEDK